jgi:hypothetical protein
MPSDTSLRPPKGPLEEKYLELAKALYVADVAKNETIDAEAQLAVFLKANPGLNPNVLTVSACEVSGQSCMTQGGTVSLRKASLGPHRNTPPFLPHHATAFAHGHPAGPPRTADTLQHPMLQLHGTASSARVAAGASRRATASPRCTTSRPRPLARCSACCYGGARL